MSKQTCCKKTSIGGQALIEGILMRGPHRTVMACRLANGEISVEDVETTSVTKKYKILGWPILRGAVNMVESLLLGYKTLMLSAERSGMLDEEGQPEAASAEIAEPVAEAEAPTVEEAEPVAEEVPVEEAKPESDAGSSVLMAGVGILGTVLGFGLALLLFMYLPSKLFDLLNRLAEGQIFAYKALFEGILKLIIFLVYMTLVSQMKDIRRVFQYHGAEHKSIFCYESGEELTVENVKKQSRFHPRCGTSFLILMLLVSILFYALLLLIPPVKAIAEITWLWTLIKLILLPLICGFGYELIRFCGRHDNWLTKIVSAPGMWVQRLSTKEPDDSMMEVAIAALSAVIPENGEDEIA